MISGWVSSDNQETVNLIHISLIQTRFWKNILHQRELYIKCQDSGGSVLDSPSFVRPEIDVRENSVLHYLLHHLKLTSEDKTNYYNRLLNR